MKDITMNEQISDYIIKASDLIDKLVDVIESGDEDMVKSQANYLKGYLHGGLEMMNQKIVIDVKPISKEEIARLTNNK